MVRWYEEDGRNSDVVMCSRIRLARNIADYKFADRITDAESTELKQRTMDKIKQYQDENYILKNMSECPETQRLAMKERRLLSSYLASNKNGAVAFTPNEKISIMINAEDHIRIQVLSSGMNIPSCFKKANEIDDYFDTGFEYAYDDKYGYLTTYPTNVGTGMRASYTMHLPGLAQTKKLPGIATELGRFGITLRNVYSEEMGSTGNLFQISNQNTLGVSEREIIRNLDNISEQIIEQEREQRQYYLIHNHNGVEDEVFKSYGVLKYGRRLSFNDAMMLLSEVMLGLNDGLINFEGTNGYFIYKMMVEIQPGNLLMSAHKSLSVEEVEIERAEYIRKNLPDLV